jgi:hypothetical protein
MLTKLIAGLVVSLGFLFGGDQAGEKPAPKDCCKARLACCARDRACCAAPAKNGCCARGMKCCAKDAACCAAVQECCRTGTACCNEVKACCGPVATKQAKDCCDSSGKSCCAE